MSKDVTISEINDQTHTDFARLLFLVDHGVLSYAEFMRAVNVLAGNYTAALKEERRVE